MTNEDLTGDADAGEIATSPGDDAVLGAKVAAPQGPGRGWRQIVAVVVAVLAIIIVVNAAYAVWLKTTLLDEDQFVATLAQLPKNESVAAALSARIADGLVNVMGVEESLEASLPEGLAFLAAPLTTSIRDFVAEVADQVIRSDAVTTLWTNALRVTHMAVSAVVSGNDRALIAQDGQVAIDLDQIAKTVVDRVEAAGLELPDVDASLDPIVIYESDQLVVAQNLVRAINFGGWFLPLVALLLVSLAILTATNRRRIVGFIGFGTALALLLSLAGVRIVRFAPLRAIEDEVSRGAAAAVSGTLLAGLLRGTWALLVVAFLVGFVAWLTGPSQRASRLKASGGRTIDRWRRPAEAEPTGITVFLIERKRNIQVGVVILGLLFMLFGPTPSGLLVIGTAVVVLVLVVLVEVLAGPAVSSVENREGSKT